MLPPCRTESSIDDAALQYPEAARTTRVGHSTMSARYASRALDQSRFVHLDALAAAVWLEARFAFPPHGTSGTDKRCGPGLGDDFAAIGVGGRAYADSHFTIYADTLCLCRNRNHQDGNCNERSRNDRLHGGLPSG